MTGPLRELAASRTAGRPRGIASICSAHPMVLRAALRLAARTDEPVLIEATCNQVNHLGGYTGMRPADFVARVLTIAAEEGCPADRILLGGDHLGPSPWRHLPAAAAMAEAETMMRAFVEAGFRKLHLDASMGCAGEADGLDDETTANRAAHLAAIAEDAATGQGEARPLYIIGTEVPPPGGADHELTDIAPTRPDAARRTLAVHEAAFRAAGLVPAWDRVIGLVVQPGVEFGNRNVIGYDRKTAAPLARMLEEHPQLVFEAHSTDYQGETALRALVEDGFAILKVGPELTFLLREALYGLDLIASDLIADYGERPLYYAMDAAMCADPGHWARHYAGPPAEQKLLRHYSLSDRIRYYWPAPEARAAVDRLFDSLGGRPIPAPLLRQHLPWIDADIPCDPEALVIRHITHGLETYRAACRGDLPA